MKDIRYLAQAYFHQDYDLEAETPIQVIESFRLMESPDLVASLHRSIQEILLAGMSDDELAALWLDDADASYDPRADGLTMEDWFRLVADVLILPRS